MGYAISFILGAIVGAVVMALVSRNNKKTMLEMEGIIDSMKKKTASLEERIKNMM